MTETKDTKAEGQKTAATSPAPATPPDVRKLKDRRLGGLRRR